jgi:hypothetical protein
MVENCIWNFIVKVKTPCKHQDKTDLKGSFSSFNTVKGCLNGMRFFFCGWLK